MDEIFETMVVASTPESAKIPDSGILNSIVISVKITLVNAITKLDPLWFFPFIPMDI